mgnify:CR=1 FL=1
MVHSKDLQNRFRSVFGLLGVLDGHILPCYLDLLANRSTYLASLLPPCPLGATASLYRRGELELRPGILSSI